MIPPNSRVVLASGESVSFEELGEAFDLFAENEVSYPLLSQSDWIKARVELAFQIHELRSEL